MGTVSFLMGCRMQVDVRRKRCYIVTMYSLRRTSLLCRDVVLVFLCGHMGKFPRKHLCSGYYARGVVLVRQVVGGERTNQCCEREKGASGTREDTREATRDDGFRNEGRHVREDAPILTLSIHSEFHQEHLHTTIPAKSFVHRWSILVDVIGGRRTTSLGRTTGGAGEKMESLS